jgi:hypothetical protein
MGLNIAHNAYNGLGHPVAFRIVLNGYGVVHHFLEMASVLGYNELWSLRIVF